MALAEAPAITVNRGQGTLSGERRLDTSTDAGGPVKVYCWLFGRAEFDESRWELRIAGQPAALERKPLEVLHYLLRHSGEVVTKEELLAEVWAGRIVVEAVLTNAVGKLRKALEEDGQEIVTTLSRVGYRLAVPVSRRQIEFLPEDSRLQVGDTVPRRQNWKLETPLARTAGNEVWLARQIKTRETRVFKFSLAGKGLHALKREVTIARLLRQALGERGDFVHVIDWDFDRAPYFIESEYGGIGLDRWPEEGRVCDVPLASRLALFADAVDAVAAAHGVGVLHKDLKPANLLLYEVGGVQRIRVADFGSSRLFDSGWLDQLGITHLGMTQTQAITRDTSGTPLYLAPELAVGQASTVKSDIYALGVTLYQLVVGDFRRPLAAGWENDIADPLLRQDIADAASGDPAKRLESAVLLAERIRSLEVRREQRALEEAVRARIADGEKRLAKIRARRPWMIAAMVSLVAGLVFSGSMWFRSEQQARVAAEQRIQAEKQAKRAEAVVNFLSNDLIRSVTPEGAGYEQNPTIKDMMVFASANTDEKFKNDRPTLASVHAALGASWAALFEAKRSVEHYRKAWTAYSGEFGADEERVLVVQYNLVEQLIAADGFDEAGGLLDAADKLAGARLGEQGKLAFWSSWTRGKLFQARMKVDEAEVELRRAAQLHNVVFPEQQAKRARIRLALADVYQRQGKFTEVVALMREALADPDLESEELRNSYKANLAKMLSFKKSSPESLSEALALAKEAADSTARMLGPDAQLTLIRYSEVGRAHARAGDCKEALEVYRRIWKLGVGRYGLSNRNNLLHGSQLASTETKCGEKQVGIQLQGQLLDSMEKFFPEDPYTDSLRYQAGTRMVNDRNYKEALAVLDRIDAAHMAAVMSSPSAKYWIEVQRGRAQIGLGDKLRGRERIAAALDGMVKMGIDPKAPGLVVARKYLLD